MNVARRSWWLIPLVVVFKSVLCPFTGTAAVALSIGQSFSGISYGTFNTNSSALPPDSDGEIGPDYYVEFINGMFVVYDKASGELVDLKTDVDFWANARVGIDVGNGVLVSDPRIIYDPASRRWFASQIDINYQIDFNTLSAPLVTNNSLLPVY